MIVRSFLQFCHSAILQLNRALDLLDESLSQFVDRSGYGAACGVLVPAPAEFLGDDADVDVTLGSHADAIVVALGLLEEDNGLNFLDRQWLVDETFRVVVRAARGTSHRVVEKENADPV